MIEKLLFTFILFAFTFNAFSQVKPLDDLLKSFQSVIDTSDAKVGISAIHIKTGEEISVNAFEKYPMQSVFKFPLAMAILNEIDKGSLSLNENIFISEKDLLPDTYSPLREMYPRGNISLPLSEIMKYTVSLSDNNGCDILFRILGGTEILDAYIKSLGIDGISVVYNEEQMHSDSTLQHINSSTPSAMSLLLKKFYSGNVLSKSSYDFLLNMMLETQTGTNRIKSLLPSDVKVAHKTDSSGSDVFGFTSAVNDAGIVILPNGTVYALTVFVSDSFSQNDVLEKVIAIVSKLIYEYWK